MEIKRYSSVCEGEWNAFVERSRQGTFLFNRGYMDYHSDRFDDFSLMAYDRGVLKGVLPANRVGNVLYSHQGLTYGGWLTQEGMDASGMLGLWAEAAGYLIPAGIGRMVYKCIPWIYSRMPSEEDRYALFRSGARWESCQVASVVDLRNGWKFDSNGRRNAAKASRAGVRVVESDDFGGFWRVLTQVLAERYGVAPVHSLAEMELLKGRFNDDIRLVLAVDAEGEVLAGTVLYIAGRVVHVQYIASSHRGREEGALALVFSRVMSHFNGYDFFDFGTSCENGGLYLNEGLLRQKSGFGGRAVVYESFIVDLAEIKTKLFGS